MIVLDDTVNYLILIKYGPEEYVVSQATFLKDFGPWRRGEHCSHLEFDFAQGIVSELSDDSVNSRGQINEDKKRILKSCRFRISASNGD